MNNGTRPDDEQHVIDCGYALIDSINQLSNRDGQLARDAAFAMWTILGSALGLDEQEHNQ